MATVLFVLVLGSVRAQSTLRLGDILTAPVDPTPAEKIPPAGKVPSAPMEWRTFAPDAPPVLIPPADWFRMSPSQEEAAPSDPAEALAKLLEGWEGDEPPTLRRRDLFEEPPRIRRHDDPALDDQGSTPDRVEGHSVVTVENGFQRLCVELKFLDDQQSDRFPVTVILSPGVSEKLAIPTGRVRLERRVWNPAVPEPAFRVDHYAEQDLSASRLYLLSLRPQEEERIARELENAGPSAWNYKL